MSEQIHQLSAQEQTDARTILQSAPIAYVSVAGPRPYVVPMNFVYDSTEEPGRILLRSGEGRKSRAMVTDPRICIAILGEATFDPGPDPYTDLFAYRSVLIEGTAVLLEDRAERVEALRMFVAKYHPKAIHEPLNEATFARTLVFSVATEALTFKQRRRWS
ncbi:MAG: pyridoxamine 5'-phosphate oxidase family protein [Thermoleophilia bacterium]|jgi:nitroimidazol reductase NimA-like FMN-containing flavoprotein (pyridoxamine 5'-phosphate oxidase superfamily)